MIYLAQCDSTAGLLSRDARALNICKSAPAHKALLIESSSLSTLKRLIRVPNKYKHLIRKSRLKTFIYPNAKAIRLVQDKWHLRFLSAHRALYSTSANLSGQHFNKQWALKACDVVVYDKRGLSQKASSKIYKINNYRIQRRR
ncbi:Sua5 YciO YrdC YwlC family protein [Helicobacter jaachi]|uniref:Sua5 YciO YrdC YwlC family protein n=1 Tax=Helicobacter jaachi TaxID=1677920 RepID=A0A4U8T6E5_9HELI|nr:Sua5 YciO YrdC YwlC family protein [Helicobacter jaachi]TLD95180.1 Sua5 YciO YrdC YwlC family protein [Helicobacter jaachi]